MHMIKPNDFIDSDRYIASFFIFDKVKKIVKTVSSKRIEIEKNDLLVLTRCAKGSFIMVNKKDPGVKQAPS